MQIALCARQARARRFAGSSDVLQKNSSALQMAIRRKKQGKINLSLRHCPSPQPASHRQQPQLG
jgi:hypothetical protein